MNLEPLFLLSCPALEGPLSWVVVELVGGLDACLFSLWVCSVGLLCGFSLWVYSVDLLCRLGLGDQ